MYTKSKIFIAIIILLTAAAASVWYFVATSTKPVLTEIRQGNATAAEDQPQASSDSKYATLKGDAFDEAYITDMLAHHEGALNMGEQASAISTREEIRMLAIRILESQGMEMEQMRKWQQEWGFKIAPSEGHLNHGGGGLEKLTGEAYDKEFLKQMIIHHEQAIEMSQFAGTNAKRQEVKDLASAVIRAQTTEIEQMKQWQEEWGY
jgi:uncharacterized protein (DUF305 family)